MDINDALAKFDALSQETRLRAFRFLVEAGTNGLPAGVLGEKLGTAHNTLSFHLTHLSNAGMVTSRKAGRSIIYSANYDAMRALIGFMVRNCCNDQFATIQHDEINDRSIIELAEYCEASSGKRAVQ